MALCLPIRKRKCPAKPWRGEEETGGRRISASKKRCPRGNRCARLRHGEAAHHATIPSSIDRLGGNLRRHGPGGAARPRHATGAPAARRANAVPAQHRLDLERGHGPAAGRLRRPPGADARARRAGEGVDPLHPCVHDRARLRAQPCRHHHGHVPTGDRRAAHAHDREHRARAARSLSRRAALLRQGVSGIPARRRLLHEQPGEDRLPVRRALHDLG